MTAEEARELCQKKEDEILVDMEWIFSSIDRDIKEAAEDGRDSCCSTIYGCDKPWEQIYKERELIEKHYTELGFGVECLGYNRACMWDEYKITW